MEEMGTINRLITEPFAISRIETGQILLLLEIFFVFREKLQVQDDVVLGER